MDRYVKNLSFEYLQNYDHICQVGEGTYGKVYRCHVKGSNEVVAIKKFKLSDEGEENSHVLKTAMREVGMLRTIQHDHIVNLFDVFRHHGCVCLVFEFVQRSVLQLLEKKTQGLEEFSVKCIIWQLLQALHYLHSMKSTMHRDIKPENLLISSQGVVKLCDFGFARKLHEPNSTSNSRGYSTYVATRWYRAPELLIRSPCRGHYGVAVDIWATGCLVAELLTGRPAFPGSTDMDQLSMILACTGPIPQLPMHDMECKPGTLRPLSTRYAHLGSAAVNFMEHCLRGDPSSRPSAAELLKHPWLVDDQTSFLTPEFLSALERDRVALAHRRETVLRHQRMNLTTAQVLKIKPTDRMSTSYHHNNRNISRHVLPSKHSASPVSSRLGTMHAGSGNSNNHSDEMLSGRMRDLENHHRQHDSGSNNKKASPTAQPAAASPYLSKSTNKTKPATNQQHGGNGQTVTTNPTTGNDRNNRGTTAPVIKSMHYQTCNLTASKNTLGAQNQVDAISGPRVTAVVSLANVPLAKKDIENYALTTRESEHSAPRTLEADAPPQQPHQNNNTAKKKKEHHSWFFNQLLHKGKAHHQKQNQLS